MKSFLYAGAALMIGASIYGFVDYKQTSRKKEFKNMYTEAPANVTTDPKTSNTAVSTTEVSNSEVKTATNETKKAGNESKKAVVKKNTAVKKTKKKRTFSTKLFSRGALDERYIEPVEPEEKKN